MILFEGYHAICRVKIIASKQLCEISRDPLAPPRVPPGPPRETLKNLLHKFEDFHTKV